MTDKYRILIAEDHTILREGLRALLTKEPDLEVVGEVDNGKDAYRSVATLTPDLVIMDLSMPHTNGTEAIKNITRRFPQVKIIVLTFHKAEEYVHAALDAGAHGYVLKDESHIQLMVAIRGVLAGKTYLSPSICDHVVTGYLGRRNTSERVPSWERLTQREREVVKLIAEGYRNKDIANYLSLSPKTVEKHRSNLMRKLDLHSVSSLTAYAIENGLITQ